MWETSCPKNVKQTEEQSYTGFVDETEATVFKQPGGQHDEDYHRDVGQEDDRVQVVQAVGSLQINVSSSQKIL